jgi:hypothetical protein
MRALGAWTRQLRTCRRTGPFGASGAILGISIGFLVSKAGHGGRLPPTTWLLVAVLGTLLAIAGLTVVPATTSARQPVAEVLQTEAA